MVLMMNILVLNSGSSSLKCALFQIKGTFPTTPVSPQWEHSIDTEKMSSIRKKIEALCKDLDVDVIGHRIVHGGEKYTRPVVITQEVIEEIRNLIPLAPLHQPRHLEEIGAITTLFPQKKQVAVFDTGFHHTLKEDVYTYPLPYSYRKLGVRKYGFHGISHQYVAERGTCLLKNSSLKIVTCHLGAGASVCAVKSGMSCDTSMGLTPLDGLMMNTRPGSVDPGILLYLLENRFKDLKELSNDLNDHSGLLGISGTTQNMDEIIKTLKDPRAKLAFEIYVHRLTQEIASMAASMEGIDALIFTGGVGENAALLREVVCKKLSFLNLALDSHKNHAVSKEDRMISGSNSKIAVLVVHTREDFQIAKDCYNIVN